MRLLRFLLYWIGIGMLVITAALTLARRDDPQPAWMFFATGEGYHDPDTIYRMPSDGGLPDLTIADGIPNLVNTLLSPSGSWAVVVSQDEDGLNFYSMGRDGHHFGPLDTLSTATIVGDPVWSPTDDWLILNFWHSSQIESDVYRFSPNDARLERLTDAPGIDYVYRWSADGRWIEFVSSRDGSQHLYRMRPDGSEQQWVGDMPISMQCHSWRPDEAWMVSIFGEAYVTNLYQDISDDYHVAGECVSWTPDEQALIFSFGKGIANQLFRMNRDGSAVEAITNDPAHNYKFVAWSPDGAWMVFASTNLKEHDHNLHTMHPDGSHITQITDFPGDESIEGWSPDGEWMIFRNYSMLVNDLYRIRPDGSGLQRLNDAPNSYWLTGWSPDGEWMLLQSVDDAHDLYRMRLDGSQHQRLTNNPGYDSVATWTPDEKWMILRHGNRDLYRMRPDGSHVERLTNIPLEDYFLAWSPVINLAWHNGLLSGIALSLIVMARWLGSWLANQSRE